jgi:hypothetical protein
MGRICLQNNIQFEIFFRKIHYKPIKKAMGNLVLGKTWFPATYFMFSSNRHLLNENIELVVVSYDGS